MNITTTYLPPRLHECFTGTPVYESSNNKEPAMFTNEFFTKTNKFMDRIDQGIGMAVFWALLVIIPLHATAAIVKAHTHVERVPILSPINAKLLADTLMPVRGVVLHPMSMRVPAPLPFKIRK